MSSQKIPSSCLLHFWIIVALLAGLVVEGLPLTTAEAKASFPQPLLQPGQTVHSSHPRATNFGSGRQFRIPAAGSVFEPFEQQSAQDNVVLSFISATARHRALPDGESSPYDLFLDVNYDHDWIEGAYPAGHDVTLVVTESDGTTVKASTTITTAGIPWWSGETGFATNMEAVVWDPEGHPDIQPGDWVFADVTVEETNYHAEVQLGAISGSLEAESDKFTGTLSAPWLPQDELVWVQCHPWGAPWGTSSKDASVLPNGEDVFSCDWSGEWDVQPGQEIAVLYQDPADHWVFSVHFAYSNQLVLKVHYDHDWIGADYLPGHDIYLEVRDSGGLKKADISLTTTVLPGWGGRSGFNTGMEAASWRPSPPDIEPGDMIYGKVDEGAYTATLQIGHVTATHDFDADEVSGTVEAPWLEQNEAVRISCEIWQENSPQNKEDWIFPDGEDTYNCSWAGEWDLDETTNLMVVYFEPDGHALIGDFSYPASRLRIEKWLENGEPGEGGVASFTIQYRNEGQAAALNTVITDIFEEGLTYISDTSGFTPSIDGNTVSWQAGSLVPGESVEFTVFAQVTAEEGETVTNTATIISDGYDAGNPEDRTRTWSGTVIGNDTHLNVGKDTWTWNPAAGQDFVYSINVCNNGPTGSTQLTLTDTLPGEVELVDWWGRQAGWEQDSLEGQTLTLVYPSVPGWSCRDVYLRVTLGTQVQEGDQLVNRAVISASNDDPDEEDNEFWLYHHVGAPYTDLSVNLGWRSGVLVPGGQYRYEIQFRNEGNLFVSAPIALRATLPAGTSLVGWESGGPAAVGEPEVDGHEVTWPVESLIPGYFGTIEVIIAIDPDTEVGTALVHSAAIEPQYGEENTENNSASLTEYVRDHGPNLRVSKWGDWHGDSRMAWYSLGVENVGDETVEDVSVRDDLPALMELAGGIGVDFWEFSEVEIFDDYFTVTLDRLEPGWNIGIHFNTRIPEDTPVEIGTILTNTATVSPTTGDSYPDDNQTSFDLTFTLGPKPDLRIDKQIVSGEPGEGGNAIFHVQYINQGSATATGVELIDTLGGMTYISDTSGIAPTVAGSEITWVIGDLDPGDWVHFEVLVKIELEAGEDLGNTIEITTTSPFVDGDPSQRTSHWEGSVIENDTHLRVGINTWTENPAPGERFVYAYSVCNQGQTASSQVTLTAQLPENTAFVNWFAREEGWAQGAQSGQMLELNNQTIPSGSCREVFVRVLLDAGVEPGDLITNIAEIASTSDLSPDDNLAVFEHHAGGPFLDLSIWQDWNWGSLVPGGEYHYNINFRNNGNIPLPLDATTTVTARIPAGTSFIGWNQEGWADANDPEIDGDTVTWRVTGLDAGLTHIIEIWLAIDEEAQPGTILENEVAITEHDGDLDKENNHARFAETVRAHGPNLRIRKWGDWHGYGDGHNAWYRLQVENIGDESVENVTVTDMLPTGMEIDGGIGVGFWQYWEITMGESSFTVFLERLEPGWNVGMDVNVVIPGEEPVPMGRTFTNMASVTADPADTDPSDNSALFILGSGPDMFVDKSWVEGAFLPGEQLQYLLKFGNKQTGHAKWWNMAGDAILVDTLPEGMSFVSSYWHCHQETEWCLLTPTQDGQELTWSTWPMGAGEWNEILLTVAIDASIGQGNTLINRIQIFSDEADIDLDPFLENNSSSFRPDLDLEAPLITSADNTWFTAGESGNFNVTTSGYPTPVIASADFLPSWLTLIDQHDGTAILSGTPPEKTSGMVVFTIGAANGVEPVATQSFTLRWKRTEFEIFLPLILR